MAAPPFINSTGLVSKILNKIIEAQTPARFTQDFLATKLGFSSGSAKPIIPLLKRIGFLSNDGVPTDIYARFRNPTERGSATAEAMRQGYNELYARNEYAHDLPREKLRDLVIQVTGASKDSSMVPAIVGTFLALKDFADFDSASAPAVRGDSASGERMKLLDDVMYQERPRREERSSASEDEFRMNLAYTINLNLPESTNPDVFNAIFKALKENLLKR